MTEVKEHIFHTSENCFFCTFGDGIAVLDARNNSYFSLNPVGAFIWNCLSNGKTASELADLVSADFNVPTAQCADDISVLLAELSRHQLITTS